MKDIRKHLKVALVQATPVMFDKDATIDKVCRQIREAGSNGAELIVFPEYSTQGLNTKKVADR